MSATGIRWTVKHGRRVLILDFYYLDSQGKKTRFRRLASVQNVAAAKAEAARLMQLAAATGDPKGEHATPQMTFSAFVEGPWQALYAPRLRPETRVRYEALLRQGVTRTFGALRLDEIEASHVLSYAAALSARGVKSRAHTSLITSILRAAVASKALGRMPDLPAHERASRKLPDCPSSDEVGAILSATRGWLHLAVSLAAFAGLRSGEVRALEVRDVDLRAGTIHVCRAISDTETVTPKGDHDRTVPISPQLVDLLRAACRDKLPAARVVLTQYGTTPHRQGIRDRLDRALQVAGLRPRSFHSLRHYFCSSLLRHGASVEAVRMVAGHKDLQTTARYLHAAIDEVRAVMGAGPPAVPRAKPKSKNAMKDG